jgi:hypothetical protein
MPRKPTVHAQLDQRRQDAAAERVKARDLEAQLRARKRTWSWPAPRPPTGTPPRTSAL